MKLIFGRKPKNPSLYIFGVSSCIYPHSRERTVALHVWWWSVVFFPKS